MLSARTEITWKENMVDEATGAIECRSTLRGLLTTLNYIKLFVFPRENGLVFDIQ
jgi:hypothetical protein